MWQNSNSDKTQKFKFDDKTQHLKLWQNTRAQIVTKLKIWQISICEEKNVKHFDTLTNDEMFSGQRFEIFAMFLLSLYDFGY